MLFSLFTKNLPRILIPKTLSPWLDSIVIIVHTHSYRIAWTVFHEFSVFDVAISAKMSEISSLTSGEPSPKTHIT